MKVAFVDMSGWDAEDAPKRKWAVLDRLPLRQPALFSGEGATGKTILELQLCAAHVLGRDWLDTLPEFGPAGQVRARRVTDLSRRPSQRSSTSTECGKGLKMKQFRPQSTGGRQTWEGRPCYDRALRHLEIFCTPKKELTMRRRASNSRRKPLPRLPEAVLTEGQISPLQYMLAIINDPTASARRRDRMAVVAARYCHPRAGNLRKKDAEAEAAEKVGGREWGDDLAADDWPQ